MAKHFTFCRIYGLIFVFLIVFSSLAFAHRLNVFAWVEGDRIEVETKFMGGAKAQEARVELVAENGKVLQTTKTDASGKASLALPAGFQPQVLTVVVNAGEGHRNQWKIPAQEFSTTDGKLGKSFKDVVQATADDAQEKIYTQRQMDEAIKLERLNIETKVIVPLRKSLAESQEPKIGVKEVVGGIGWLIGIFGILAWYSTRRRK